MFLKNAREVRETPVRGQRRDWLSPTPAGRRRLDVPSPIIERKIRLFRPSYEPHLVCRGRTSFRATRHRNLFSARAPSPWCVAAEHLGSLHYRDNCQVLVFNDRRDSEEPKTTGLRRLVPRDLLPCPSVSIPLFLRGAGKYR